MLLAHHGHLAHSMQMYPHETEDAGGGGLGTLYPISETKPRPSVGIHSRIRGYEILTEKIGRETTILQSTPSTTYYKSIHKQRNQPTTCYESIHNYKRVPKFRP